METGRHVHDLIFSARCVRMYKMFLFELSLIMGRINMRKKQLMALLLAGTLTVSMTPCITSAEGFASEMETPSEDVAVIGGVDGPTDIYVEDADHMPVTEAPAEDIPAEEIPPADVPEEEVPGTDDAGNTTPETAEPTPEGSTPDGAETPDSTEPAPDGTDGFTDGNTDPAPAPDTTEPEDPAETPVPTVTATPSETPVPTDTPIPTDTPVPTEAPSVGSGTPEDPFTDFSALKEAIENAALTYSNGMDIYIGNLAQREVKETITVKSNIRLIVVSPTEMVREAEMLGSFFHVESGSLEFVVNDGASLTLNGQTANGQTAAAPLIDVEKGGNLIINSGVTLSGNHNAAGAAAIDAKGITVLNGATITANKSSKGAVYVSGDGILQVYGSTVITGNTSASDDKAALNTVLAEGKTLDLIAELSEGAAIGLTAEKAADKTKIVNITDDIFETPWREKLSYDNSSFVIDGEGLMTVPSTPTPTAAPTPTATPTPTGAPTGTPAPEVSVTPTQTPEPSATPTPENPAPSVAYVADSIQWSSHDEVSVKLRIQNVTAGSVYYYLIKPGSEAEIIESLSDPSARDTLLKEIKETGVRTPVDAETDILIHEKNLTDETGYVLYAYAENPSQNTDINIAVVDLVANAANGRPGAEPAPTDTPSPSVSPEPSPSISPEPSTSPTPSVEPHEPVVYEASESIVLGLEKPLEFYPGRTYEFQVIGAGTQNYYEYYGKEVPTAGEGDVKWVPRYWSTAANPSAKQQHTSWRIGHPSGITTESTFNLYIFLEKCVYKNGDWKATGEINRITSKFSSAAIEISGTPAPGGLNDLSQMGSDMSTSTGDTAIQKKKDTKKKAVSTADETPVENTFLLLAASLLAGGYVITRKRIKTK